MLIARTALVCIWVLGGRTPLARRVMIDLGSVRSYSMYVGIVSRLPFFPAFLSRFLFLAPAVLRTYFDRDGIPATAAAATTVLLLLVRRRRGFARPVGLHLCRSDRSSSRCGGFRGWGGCGGVTVVVAVMVPDVVFEHKLRVYGVIVVVGAAAAAGAIAVVTSSRRIAFPGRHRDADAAGISRMYVVTRCWS